MTATVELLTAAEALAHGRAWVAADPDTRPKYPFEMLISRGWIGAGGDFSDVWSAGDPDRPVPYRAVPIPDPPLRVGDPVMHGRYGRGVVVLAEPDDGGCVVIWRDGWGYRVIHPDHLTRLPAEDES